MKTTQGRWLIAKLKRRGHTYLEMLEYRVSLSPWKRVKEALAANERLVKGKTGSGLVTWRVVSTRTPSNA